MIILRDMSIFWAMFHVIFLFVMLFRSRFTKKKTIIASAIGMGILMILNGAGLVIFGIDVLSKMFLFTCSIPSFLFFYLMSADKRFRFLLTFCLADTICLWIMAVTSLLDYYLGGGQFILMFVSRLVAYPLIEYLMWRYLRKPYMELQEAVEKGWGIFAGMTILYYILLVVTVQYPVNIVERPEDTFLCVLVLVLMLFNYATIFAALYRQLLLYRKQQGERILMEQKNTLEAQLDNQQRIRRMKHDMKAHTVMLSGLLTKGKTKEAQEYLKGVEEEMDSMLGQFCSNPYIDAVLTQYYQKLQELGADCRFDIQIGDIEIHYMELCQIISNSLENVCNALQGLAIDKRKMSVKMKYSRNYLMIRIRNRCRDGYYVDKGTIPATDKEGLDHGYGLLTVRDAARRLGGDMVCYTENGNFVLDVMVSCRSFPGR
ncbi:MAG: sensor histidine kinase [Lachnospiraceae bacterium]|nr:sensor histidine kinase [Lachnospiraceae bacterium]